MHFERRTAQKLARTTFRVVPNCARGGGGWIKSSSSLASEASDEEGLSAARAAFARAAPLAADLGARYGDSSAGLRLLLARRIGRLADLDVAAALFALAALADGDDARFAVARSVAHSNARRPPFR